MIVKRTKVSDNPFTVNEVVSFIDECRNEGMYVKHYLDSGHAYNRIKYLLEVRIDTKES